MVLARGVRPSVTLELSTKLTLKPSWPDLTFGSTAILTTTHFFSWKRIARYMVSIKYVETSPLFMVRCAGFTISMFEYEATVLTLWHTVKGLLFTAVVTIESSLYSFKPNRVYQILSSIYCSKQLTRLHLRRWRRHIQFMPL